MVSAILWYQSPKSGTAKCPVLINSGSVSPPTQTAGPSVTPDFLLVLVALANSMRLSLMKAAHAALSGVASEGNPGSLGMTKERVALHLGMGGGGCTETQSSQSLTGKN
jgi:hypothetical protein